MPDPPIRRVVLLVLDGLGVGASPDAARFGDDGTDTFGHACETAGGAKLPVLQALGLGNLHPARGVPPAEKPRAAYGRMREVSPAKDTVAGHWEMMGCPTEKPFATFPEGFSLEIVEAFKKAAGVAGMIGNKAASGTEIIQECGPAHERTKLPIVYTSADSVFQIAAHEGVVPLTVLYAWCLAARRILDRWNVARVIARPFVGKAGSYTRTYNRRDFAMAPPRETVLDRLGAKGIPAVGVGKIHDIFSGRGLADPVHTEGNRDGMAAVAGLLADLERGLVFANLVDTDMLYGHRRDPKGFVKCLEEFDDDLRVLLERLGPSDLLLLTADHGCDPTFAKTTDHTREDAPLLAFRPGGPAGRDLGVRSTFADLGATVAEALGVPPPAGSRSFLSEVV
ncbi:MAG TPA: phosphopentomutase [Planctomycetota bacterium]|nr:phosphopentomutase [Planctomycetota bacterium]